MKIIKVKPANATTIIEAIQSHGNDAEIVNFNKIAPSAWVDFIYFSTPPENWDGDLTALIRYMVPIRISCSGTTAHKIIAGLKESGVIPY
jgi:hypothetical protein